jgi:hypothetical protein
MDQVFETTEHFFESKVGKINKIKSEKKVKPGNVLVNLHLESQ